MAGAGMTESFNCILYLTLSLQAKGERHSKVHPLSVCQEFDNFLM